jgi:hypothetical protein
MVDPGSLGIGAMFGAAVVAAISGVFSVKASKAQIEVAEINREKETTLQKKRLKVESEDRERSEIREKICEVHAIISRMTDQYSQTRSYIDWTDDIERATFRSSYQEDRAAMHKAISIIDIYLTAYKAYQADIRKGMYTIYSKMNVFWGNQEELLRNHNIEDKKSREIHRNRTLSEIIRVSRELSEHADSVQQTLVQVADAVNRQAPSGAHPRRFGRSLDA